MHAGPRFEQYASLIQAVTAHKVVGLVPWCLVQDDSRAGEVVEAFPSKVLLHDGHFLCYAPDCADSPVFQAFRCWIHKTCADQNNLATQVAQKVAERCGAKPAHHKAIGVVPGCRPPQDSGRVAARLPAEALGTSSAQKR